MSRTHLFLSGAAEGWGEVLIAIKLGRQLVARGDRVVFLASSMMATALSREPFRYGHIDRSMHRLATALPILIAETRADTLVLVDATTVYSRLFFWKQDMSCIERVSVPVIAFDVWDLQRSGRYWDVGTTMPMPEEALRHRRMIPSPLARPDPDPGVYDALPAAGVLTPSERSDVRRSLGIDDNDRLILLPEARWQSVEAAQLTWQKRTAAHVHELLGRYLAELGERVRVVHVGPSHSASLQAALGTRYRRLEQMPPDEFSRLVAASDLLVTLNVAGTSLASAIAAGIPILFLSNGVQGATVEEVVAQLPARPSEQLVEWLAKVLPLARFHVWPLGLHAFLEPVLRDNLYASCMRRVELLDEAAVRSAFADVLDNAATRDELRTSAHEFVTRASKLPSCIDVFDSYLR